MRRPVPILLLAIALALPLSLLLHVAARSGACSDEAPLRMLIARPIWPRSLIGAHVADWPRGHGLP